MFTSQGLDSARLACFVNSLSGNADQVISYEDVLVVLQSFTTRLPMLVAKLRKSPHVAATSIYFFRRFYTHRSMLDFDPKVTMACCFYLACKVEEERVDLRTLVDAMQPDTTKELICDIEYELLDALGFELILPSPFIALDGLVLDMQEKLREHFPKVRALALTSLSSSILSDALLLYSPSVLALAAIRSAAERDGLGEKFSQYLSTLPNSSTVLELLDSLRTFLANLPSPSKESVQESWKRLRAFYSLKTTT